jgi:hypothetical protein
MEYLNQEPRRVGPTRRRVIRQPGKVQRTTARLRTESKPVDAWRAPDLYNYLHDNAEPDLRFQLAKGPLLGSFKRWLKDGLSPSQVRAMLDVFLTKEDWHHVNGYPAWRILVARRGNLLEIAVKMQRQEEQRVRRTDREYWIGDG